MLPVQVRRILTLQTHIYGEAYLNTTDPAAQNVADEEVEILNLAPEAPLLARPVTVIRIRTIRMIVLIILPEIGDANLIIMGDTDSLALCAEKYAMEWPEIATGMETCSKIGGRVEVGHLPLSLDYSSMNASGSW